MNQVTIFCNGRISNYSQTKPFLKPNSLIICADGGTKHAVKLGLNPNVVIGDFDSLTSVVRRKLNPKLTKFIKYPKNKDFTDSDLALQYAIKQGFKEITFFGALGSRLDHFLGTLLLAARLVQKNLRIEFITDSQILYLVKDKLALKGKIGGLVSLIPIQDDVSGITTSGLKYQLKNSTLFFGKTRGISNVMTKTQARIKIHRGVLLVVQKLN